MDDERIGEALIREVIVAELKEHDDEVPDLQLSTQLPSDQEKKLVAGLGKMVRIVGDRLQDDAPFQDAVDGLIKSPGSMSEKFWQLVTKVFEDGKITWERIAVLFCVAGRMAVKVLEDHLPSLVVEIFKLTVNYFHTKLLSWVRSNGGWINSLSELCNRVQGVTPMSPHTTKHILIFIVGLAFGSIITWKLARGA